MNIARFSLEHRPVVWVVLILLVAVGVFNYFTISQREDPEFKINVALVVTIYPGASAEKVEKLVTEKLEEKFEEMSLLEELKSTTREALSVIMVKVDYEADVDIAWQKLRNKIEEVRADLPAGIMGPDVIDDFGDVTAMIYSLHSKSASPAELKRWAKKLRTALKKQPTVGKVELMGEQDEVIYIEGPLQSFTLYEFSPLTASKFLDYQNVNMPGGYARTKDRKYRLEVSGSFRIEEQLKNAVLDVSRKSGAPLKVQDVFSVRRAYKEPPLDYMLTDGVISVGLDIRMRKGENLVFMGEEVKAAVEAFRERLPEDIQLTLLHDQPREVDTFVGTFLDNLYEGLAIVVLVMFLGMGLRAAGLIALCLPLSIILTFTVMPLFHVDLETVSIAAFIIALGMLVDNAIIITDNIDVHMRRGVDAYTASWKGAWELAVPALTGTLATVMAFMPLLLMQENTGDYIRALPIVVSVSLLASLLLAVTVIPIAARRLLRAASAKTEGHGDGKAGDAGEAENRFVRFYRRMMGWSLKHRFVMMGLTALVFLGAMKLLGIVGFSFFPEAQRDQFTVDIWLPEGASLENTSTVVRTVEKVLDGEEDVVSHCVFVGKGAPRFYMTIMPEFNATNFAQFIVNTRDPRITRPLVARLNETFRKDISGARVMAKNLWMGVPVEAPIALRLSGPDLSVIQRLAGEIQDILKTIPGTHQVRDNVGKDVPSLRIDVDSEAAAMAGITNTEVALSLLTAYEGFPVTSFREGEEEIPVYMRLIESERNLTDTLDGLYVPSQTTGKKVPLKAFAGIEPVWSAGVVKRFDTRRAITVLADVQGRLAADVMKDLRDKLKDYPLPKGYSMESAGEEKERNKSFGRLLIIFGLILALIFLMLVIQFNSIKKSFVILASIPLAIIGAIVGLFVSGNSFAFMPFLGVISLAGMVIKNAVVWLEFVDKALMEDGMRLSEAIIEAGRQRLRPIILTAATTIGGLIPLALFGGSLWEGMAYAMIFGLALATVLTLVVVPVFYYAIYRREYRNRV